MDKNIVRAHAHITRKEHLKWSNVCVCNELWAMRISEMLRMCFSRASEALWFSLCTNSEYGVRSEITIAPFIGRRLEKRPNRIVRLPSMVSHCFHGKSIQIGRHTTHIERWWRQCQRQSHNFDTLFRSFSSSKSFSDFSWKLAVSIEFDSEIIFIYLSLLVSFTVAAAAAAASCRDCVWFSNGVEDHSMRWMSRTAYTQTQMLPKQPNCQSNWFVINWNIWVIDRCSIIGSNIWIAEFVVVGERWADGTKTSEMLVQSKNINHIWSIYCTDCGVRTANDIHFTYLTNNQVIGCRRTQRHTHITFVSTKFIVSASHPAFTRARSLIVICVAVTVTVSSHIHKIRCIGVFAALV